jgi:hypothetical protein
MKESDNLTCAACLRTFRVKSSLLLHQRRHCEGFLRVPIRERLHLDVAFNMFLRIFPFSICKLIREYRNNQLTCLTELLVISDLLLDMCAQNPARSFTIRVDANWILTWIRNFSLCEESTSQRQQFSACDHTTIKQKFYQLIFELLDDCYPPLKYNAFIRLRKHTFFGEVWIRN